MSVAPLDCIVVTGPTATGKTRLAVALAQQFDGEIISVDSRQVYRGMDIGTGKDLAEYGTVPYHLIDICAPDEPYHLARFLGDAQTAVEDCVARGKRLIFCGGTALWIHALLKNYQMPGTEVSAEERSRLRALDLDVLAERFRADFPKEAACFDQWQNKNRLSRAYEIAQTQSGHGPQLHITFRPLILAPYYPRAIVRARVAERLDARLETGMIHEVQTLLAQGITHERLEFFGLEYRAVSRYLRGELTLQSMRDELCTQIRQFVKRQDVFFRKFERENLPIHWIESGNLACAQALVTRFLAGENPLPPQTLDEMNALHTAR